MLYSSKEKHFLHTCSVPAATYIILTIRYLQQPCEGSSPFVPVRKPRVPVQSLFELYTLFTLCSANRYHPEPTFTVAQESQF